MAVAFAGSISWIDLGDLKLTGPCLADGLNKKYQAAPPAARKAMRIMILAVRSPLSPLLGARGRITTDLPPMGLSGAIGNERLGTEGAEEGLKAEGLPSEAAGRGWAVVRNETKSSFMV